MHAWYIIITCKISLETMFDSLKMLHGITINLKHCIAVWEDTSHAGKYMYSQ